MATRTDSKRDYSDRPDVCKRMLANFKLADEAEAENRSRHVEALKFAQGEQWDAAVIADRTAFAMPSKVYNQIPQFVHQVTNDLRMNMPQISFIPADDADKEKAEVREDIMRSIQTESEAEVAYDTAAASAVIGGWGYWRYLTEYENDKTFNQRIKCCWVPNPLAVYDDPNATSQDRLDRKFLIHVYDMTKDDFNDSYKKDADDNDIHYGTNELRSMGSETPDWAGTNKVRVAEYWEVTTEIKKLYRIKSSSKIVENKPAAYHDSRDVEVGKVTWYKCTANHVLEKREWSGKYIPYVFVSGEASLIDGKWSYDGLVRAMMGAQEQFNYAVNNAIYMASLAPKNQMVVDARAIAGYEAYWNDANTVPRAYLPYRSTDENGALLAPPQRMNNSVDLSAAANLIQMAQQNFYNVTGIYPASLGQASNEKSGRAILARQREGDTSTYHFGDNVARALRAGGRICDDLMGFVYDWEGVIKGVKEDGATRDIVINKRFIDKDGQSKEYDMTKGSFGVVVSTGPAYGTKRQEMADAMNQLAPTLIGAYPAVGPEWIRSQDWPGSETIAEAMERSLPPQLQKPVENEGLPSQVITQLQQMQDVIQQLETQLQQAGQALEDKQADIANKQADYQLKMVEMQNSGQSEQLKAETDRMKIALDAEKLQFEREKAQYERAKAETETVTKEVNEYNMFSDMGDDDMDKLPPREKLMAMLKLHDENEAAETERQQSEIMRQQEEAMRHEEQTMRSDALLQSLNQVAMLINGLTQTIAAPKVVVRDANGLAIGVTTQDTMGNA